MEVNKKQHEMKSSCVHYTKGLFERYVVRFIMGAVT